MSEEQWRVIPEFPDYSVSDIGRVKRTRDAKTAKAGRMMKPGLLPTGYATVVLRQNGRSITRYVHALVLSAFVGPRPSHVHQVAHANGLRGDNRLENLRWALPTENAADKKAHGTDQIGMKHHMRKITDMDVLEIRKLRAAGVYCKDIAAKYGLHAAYVSLVANGKRWGHLT